ncbi:hypothetical protein FOVG_19930 [Fusarium oxysporum f. sp. pisi HDV247]|uniref:Uncharacterized protein n=1 Tax=Fusarium oxysporum f. sp. pisi HDV247 TaxID=1080344 RepID=W9NKQ4_FUSOX|nr:hypothetical protein FOVG_19930 [Fusarium oxysporum f. sp. pisi HDV247]
MLSRRRIRNLGGSSRFRSRILCLHQSLCLVIRIPVLRKFYD